MKGLKPYVPVWQDGWREQTWISCCDPWDLIVIGGGITGAGIFALSSRMGLRVLLLEKEDFASGTSSRSSKLVHGGLRYLKRMELMLARGSVQERQHLLGVAPGLVEPLGFIYPVYKGEPIGPWLVEMGLNLYTHLTRDAGEYRRLEAADIIMLAPGLIWEGLSRGYYYGDAQTDDARLVFRVVHDALRDSEKPCRAINYARVMDFLRKDGKVVGVRIRDEKSGNEHEARARLVINATGVWADSLRAKLGIPNALRPLRGSHLYFDSQRFPVYQAIAFGHPDDDRPVFAYPWQGVTLVGTTDLDHASSIEEEPRIQMAEVHYLLHGIQRRFPDLCLKTKDILSVQCGIRPVIYTGKENPSAESRDDAVWEDEGLLTVTGGKLTTFRLVAMDVLTHAHKLHPDLPSPSWDTDVLSIQPSANAFGEILDQRRMRRLIGRYGDAVFSLMQRFPNRLRPIPKTPYLEAEVLWSCANEAVEHLDDLFLRRLRCGLLLPDGGLPVIESFKRDLQRFMHWDESRWTAELERYRDIREHCHGLV